MKTITQSFNPIKSPSLYSLTGDLLDALSAVELDPETGEITGMDKVDALALDTQDKLVSCACAIKNFEALAAEIKAEKKRLDARLKFTENLIDRVKSRCVESMQVLGMKSIKAAPASISLRRSQAVEVYDESQIDPRFVKVKEVKTISKTEIAQAIKSGEDVQGARIVENVSMQVK